AAGSPRSAATDTCGVLALTSSGIPQPRWKSLARRANARPAESRKSRGPAARVVTRVAASGFAGTAGFGILLARVADSDRPPAGLRLQQKSDPRDRRQTEEKMMVRDVLVVGLGIGVFCSAPRMPAQEHALLKATPATVAWGYYDAKAKPVLTVSPGDTVDIETLLTNSPKRLEEAGVPPAEVEQSLRDVTDQVKDKGPGGHVLTGPIYIEGAEIGDVLEVRIQAIKLAIPYAYNG